MRRLRDGAGALLDQALVLWFPAPDSYTGEDCVELSLHGGAAVVDGVTQALLAQGLRLAEPGEFTRRAFENGKLDLGQAEAVADLVEAETARQAGQALAQLGGALSRRHEGWRSRTVEILARLEAAVDFPDEELPPQLVAEARAKVEQLRAELDDAVARADRGLRVRAGFRVAIIGAPNAGKSSLFNALSDHDGAIVTPTPGTTRDIIETCLTVSGYRVVLADTAGLRIGRDEIEVEGIRRARAWAAGADLRLWVIDRAAVGASWRASTDLVRVGDIGVFNKLDLARSGDAVEARAFCAATGLATLDISVKSDGAAKVLAALQARVVDASGGSDFPAATRARHVTQLTLACANLSRALSNLHEPELAAEDVRLAARALERITGRVGVEDVLDGLFASFCIGK